MVRASLNYVNWKQRKRVAQDLKSIYRAATAEEAERNWRSSPRNGTGNIRRSAVAAATGGAIGKA